MTRLSMLVLCSRCLEHQSGVLVLDDRLTVVDSEGFIIFDEGPVCDDCLRVAGIDPDETLVDAIKRTVDEATS